MDRLLLLCNETLFNGCMGCACCCDGLSRLWTACLPIGRWSEPAAHAAQPGKGRFPCLVVIQNASPCEKYARKKKAKPMGTFFLAPVSCCRPNQLGTFGGVGGAIWLAETVQTISESLITFDAKIKAKPAAEKLRQPIRGSRSSTGLSIPTLLRWLGTELPLAILFCCHQ